MYLHLYDIVSTVTFLLGYCKKRTTAAAVYSLLHASGQNTFNSCSPLIQKMLPSNRGEQRRKYTFGAAQKRKRKHSGQSKHTPCVYVESLILSFSVLWTQIVAVISRTYYFVMTWRLFGLLWQPNSIVYGKIYF